MHNLIKEMLHYKNCLDGAEPDRETVARFEQRYDGILNQAKEEYEYEPPTEYYREGYNLYRRLVE